MTGKETEQQLIVIADSMKENIKNKAKQLDHGQKTALKAYQIAQSMIDQASKMVSMKFSAEAYDEKYYSVRENRVFNFGESLFSSQKSWYDSESDPDVKRSFLVYAHAVHMTHTAFLDKRKIELREAEEAGEVEAVFENKMVIDTLEELLVKWDEMWKKIKQGK